MSLFRTDVAYDIAAQGRVVRWVSALRYGKHPQARSFLRTDGGFCCLGVGCHVYDPRRWRLFGDQWSYLGAVGELPHAVVEAFQLRTPDGRYGPCPEIDSLVSANDRGATFRELADLIFDEMHATIRRRARVDEVLRSGRAFALPAVGR